MKCIHLSDLHLGKRVNGFSMLEDQRYILNQILRSIDAEQPDAVLIAGDVYDKTVPPAEAVALFDDFLVQLAARRLQVCVISGNHDSPERLAFGGRLMDRSGIHMAPVYGGTVTPVTLTDAFGPVRIYLLPFVKPAQVRACFPEAAVSSYTEAMRLAVENMAVDPSVRNILVTHQFVTGAQRSESEEISVGGADNVDAAVFAPFDYVALGHIHGPQNIGSPCVRYCGTPLKYSFSETRHQKSVTVVELGEKGDCRVRTLPLTPLHDLVELKGSYDQVTSRAFYAGTAWQTDYVHITLTDELDIPDAVGKLRSIYHNLMRLDYDNSRTRSAAAVEAVPDAQQKAPLDLFADFYKTQNGAPLSAQQRDFLADLIGRVWEEEKA